MRELADIIAGELIPQDVGGIYIAIGIDSLGSCMSQAEIADWLRKAADGIDELERPSVN